LVLERASRTIASVKKELEEVQAVWSERKDELLQIFDQSLHPFKESLSHPEKSINPETLTQEITEAMSSFRKVLPSRLHLLQELKKKKATLETDLKNAQSLASLSFQETKVLLGEKLRQKGRDLEVYLQEYEEIKSRFGGDWERMEKELKKDLERIVKDGLKNLPLESKDFPLLQNLRTGRFPTEKYEVTPLLQRYKLVMEEILNPYLQAKRLEEMVALWPPLTELDLKQTSKPSLREEARYIGEELFSRGLLYSIPWEKEEKIKVSLEEEEKLKRIIFQNYSRVVSVLVYDIRGSTIMGYKLQDAAKEKEIRNEFNRGILAIAKRLGAFLLKDTGDGGILWFGENSGRIYQALFEETREKEFSFRKAYLAQGNLPVYPSTDSGSRAIRCALEMVREAEAFVKKNLHLYGSWFKESEERKLFYEGIPFAELPPEYKRIFQIGVGIASGKPDKDVSFGLNAFGDYDLTGTLVREAYFYSRGRDPHRSVVLCDGATLLNFLLNCEKFELDSPLKFSLEENISPEDFREILRKEVKCWGEEKEKGKSYRFVDLGIIIERVGRRTVYLSLVEPETATIVTDREGEKFRIDESAILKDEKHGRGKPAEEIHQLRE